MAAGSEGGAEAVRSGDVAAVMRPRHGAEAVGSRGGAEAGSEDGAEVVRSRDRAEAVSSGDGAGVAGSVGGDGAGEVAPREEGGR
ncbi:hypothetical protein GCM10009734_74790 [Nonomuraea bangladeshensis]